MVAKSCITKRMAETHPKSWDVYHLSTGDLDFATIHRMLVKPVIISHLYVGIIINNRDLYVNPPSVGEIRTFPTLRLARIFLTLQVFHRCMAQVHRPRRQWDMRNNATGILLAEMGI